MKKLFVLFIILFVSSCGSLPEENAELEPQDFYPLIEEPLIIQNITENYRPSTAEEF